MPEGEGGVRCIPWSDRQRAQELAEAPRGAIRPQFGAPCCVGCGILVGSTPCPHQLSAQDSVLLGAHKLGLRLEAEVPDDKAEPLWTP